MALTPVQLAAAAYIGGFGGGDVVRAVQLAYAVSGGNPTAAANDHYGLWQIKKSAHPNLFTGHKWDNPGDNARMANVLWQSRASLLHPGGQFSTADWPAYGGEAYNRAALQATQGWNELQKAIRSGKSAESVLGTSRTDGSKTPEGGAAPGVAKAAGDLAKGVDITGFLSALTSPNTWLRVGEAVLGLALVLVGVAKLLGPSVMNVVPAGRIAKAIT